MLSIQATEELRRTLLMQRRMLLERVAHVKDDLHWLTDEPISEREEGQERNLARWLARLDDHDREEIAAIDAALGRITAGGYGRCASCADSIPVGRLRAVPTTATCVACAEQGETGGRLP